MVAVHARPLGSDEFNRGANAMRKVSGRINSWLLTLHPPLSDGQTIVLSSKRKFFLLRKKRFEDLIDVGPGSRPLSIWWAEH